MPIQVHTIGDSTLDNLYWRLIEEDNKLEKAKASSVEGKLKTALGKDYTVSSHTYDGFTTKSTLGSAKKGAVLPRDKEGAPQYLHTYMAEKASKQTIATPLKELQDEISKKPEDTHYVVLSVGGNDFRENLGNPFRFIKEIPQIQKRHIEITKKIKSLKGKNIKPILMLQYRTDAKNDHYLIYTVLKIIGVVALTAQIGCLMLLSAPVWLVAGKISLIAAGLMFTAGALGLYSTRKILPLSTLKDLCLGKNISMLCKGRLLETFYQPILQQAKKDKTPVLDLTNTFNPYDDLYNAGIEPGEKGGTLIAEGIAHIVKHHDYSKGSELYSKRASNYEAAENKPSHWKVSYPPKRSPSRS